jgi:MauM/NapG family ferredoxin protein
MNRRNFLRGRIVGDLLGVVADRIADVTASTTSAPAENRPAPPSERYCRSFPVLRPPGAIEEESFLAGCTRCDACIRACPHGSIVHAPPRFRLAAGTPMIDPINQPCRMCDDAPCIESCEAGVLRRDLPFKLGTARIDVTSCLSHQGGFCTVCAEQCPVPGAIEVSRGKPTVVESSCTGCGVCQHVCPAPSNAVWLMPAAVRPPVPCEQSSSGELPQDPEAGHD